MFDNLKLLFENRRTNRFASPLSIPDEDLQRLISVSQLAPSNDKTYSYKVYALTNSPEGFSKKRKLIEYARCGSDKPGDPWNDREINLSLLSGIVFYFTMPLELKDPRLNRRRYGVIDATVNATMLMMAAESMGYHTSFAASIFDYPEARTLLTGSDQEEILLAVTVSQPRTGDTVDPRSLTFFKRVNFKTFKPFIVINKHGGLKRSPSITIV